MYNTEQKARFIKGFAYTDSVRKSCMTTFEIAAPVEEEIGKDICLMTKDEAQRVIERVGGLRGNNARVNIVYAYIRWCLWNQIPGATDEGLQADRHSYEKIRLKMVSGPVHLQMCLDKIFEPESEQTTHDVYRCFCWLAFMGVPQQETLKITSDEVDFTDMVIRHKLESYPIYREAIPVLRNCATLSEFRIPHYETDVRVRPRAYGNTILRGLGDMSIATLRTRIAHKRHDREKEGIHVAALTYNTLSLSGAFYRIYEMERAGIEPDLSSLAAATMDGKNYNFGRQRLTLKGKQNQLANAYLEDYYAWKQVFC